MNDHYGTVHLLDSVDVGEDIKTCQSTAWRQDSHARHEWRVQDETADILPLRGDVAAGTRPDGLTINHDVALVAIGHLFKGVLIHHLDVTVGVGLERNAATGPITAVIIHDYVDVATAGQDTGNVVHRADVGGIAMAVDDGLGPIRELILAHTVNDGRDIRPGLLLRADLDGIHGPREPRGLGQAGIRLEAVPDLGGRVPSIPGVARFGPLSQLEVALSQLHGGVLLLIFLLLLLIGRLFLLLHVVVLGPVAWRSTLVLQVALVQDTFIVGVIVG
mmetsp:Transcript_7298/g.17368  ORF Transcript_7298/g.17368 Transcript_7298/m.17368 type:complete len:275 (-) Transcript_7298:197-1021(-)